MSYWQDHTPYLLIPVEIRVREFHAKLLLSCMAVEAGFSVVLGWAEQIKRYTSYLPRGIIIERSVAVWKLKDFLRFKRLGNHIFAWCEEGLVTHDAEFYVKYRIAEEVLRLTDTFFAWGWNQVNMMTTQIPNSAEKMVTTGNIRFDLLREPYRRLFDHEVRKLKDLYGPFILVNTNFAHYNNILGREVALNRLKKQHLIQNQNDADFFWQWSEYAGQQYHQFLRMVAHLSPAFPHHTIVVRPHPSEDPARWQHDTHALPNVRVVHDGNVIPWIMAAEVVIHNSCTTGVETYIAETPVVAYRAIRSDKFDGNLSNEISQQVTSLPELEATLRAILAHPAAFVHAQQHNQTTRKYLETYVANLDGDLAAEHIVATLRQYVRQHPLQTNGHLNAWRNRIVWRLLRAMNAIFIDTISPMIIGKTYGEHKFPDISTAEVEDILARLQKVSGRFERIHVRSLGLKSLFHLSQA